MYFDAQPPIERPVLHLARPDRKVISRLSEVQDETENFNLGQLTELTFSVPLKYETLEENKINLNAQKLLERMLIRLRSEGEERWYIISSRNIDVDSKKAMITAKSTAYTLSDIPIKAFSTVENENPDGLDYSSWTLSEIVRETIDRDEDTMWRLGDVDVEFDLKRREFTHDGSLGELVVAVAEKFGAIPIYDDLNSKIHFKHPDKIGRNRGLKLTYENYLLSMSKDTNSDSLATQLALYGSEGLTIREINPTGSTYIEDFSYFLYPYQEDSNGNVIKSSFFMSDSLAGAITRYSKKIVTLTPSFQTILTQLEILTQEFFDLETSLSIQDTLLIQKQEQIDIWLGTNNGKSNATYESEKKVIVTEMTRLQNSINSRMTQIASLAGNDYFETGYVEIGITGGQLGLLKQQLLVRNNFTTEQIKERSYYVIRKEWSNDSITDAKDLLEEGRKAFKDYSKPSLNMSLSVVDFLSSLETPFAHKQLYLGDTVRTEDDWEHRILEGKILGFTRNYYEKSLSLQIANFTKEEDGADKFLKMIYQASFAATVVNDNKYKWDLSKENNGTLNAIINDNFDAVKKKVTGGAAGLTEFSARGLTSRDYSNNSKYLVVQNGVLALTKDNGVNWGVAITPDGIVAERVIGKLIAGVNVTIEDQDGIMRILGNKLSISNRNKEEVVKLGLVSPAGQADRFGMIVDNRKNQIGIVDNEGFYISRYNGQTIEKLLWTDVDGNLNAQKITATDMKIVNGDMKSGVVKNANGDSVVQFGTFGMKIDSASLTINGGLSDSNIASAASWSSKETPEAAQTKVDAAKKALQGQIDSTNTTISTLSGSLSTFENTVNTTFKDNLITNAEALSIKSNIEVLESNKSGLVSQYNNVYTNSLLIDPQKSELKIAYDNFIAAHTGVVNTINAATSDKIITETERTDLTAKFTTYRTRLSELNTKLDAAWKAISDKFASNTAKAEADTAYNNAVGAIVDKLNIEADLPTSLSFGNFGMRATTSNPDVFAQFDYRGLYIKGGAIQIDAGSNGVRLNTTEGLVSESSLMVVSLNATDGFKMRRKSDSTSVFSVDTNGKVVLQDVLIKSGAIQWDALASAPSWTNMTDKPTYLGSDRIYSPTIQGGTIEGALFKASNYVSNDGVVGVMTLDSGGMIYKATVSMADSNYPKREYYTAYGMSRLELSSESKHINGTFKDQEIDRVTLASNSHLIITSKRKGSNSNDLVSLGVDKIAIEGILSSTLPLSIDAPVVNVDSGDIKASFDVYARTFYQNNSKVATETEVDNRINNKLDKGRVTVTVVNGGQASQFSVNFNKTFSSPPIVTVAANTTIIGSTVTGAAVTGITTTGCTIWANRTSPGDVAVNWIAVG